MKQIQRKREYELWRLVRCHLRFLSPGLRLCTWTRESHGGKAEATATEPSSVSTRLSSELNKYIQKGKSHHVESSEVRNRRL